jgi:hypothetical protein
MFSHTIVNLNINHKFSNFIKNFCDTNNTGGLKFEKILQHMIINNLVNSEPINNLKNSHFYDLPQWLFNNDSSTIYRQVRTVNSYSLDVIKSAMQKYARRGEPNDCVYSMIEMNFFKWLEGGNSSFTNFYNRMRVILLEDVGIASPSAIPVANKLLLKLRISQDEFPVELPQLAWLMCNSLHSRTYSMIRSYYYLNPPLTSVPNDEKYKLFGKDEENYRKEVDSLVSCLERKDLACSWWLEQIVKSEVKLEIKKYNSTRPGFLGFSIIEWFLKKQTNIHPLIWENFNITLKWFKELKIKESSICPFHPMFLYIMEDNLDFTQENYLLSESKPELYWSDNLLNKKRLFIPAVYDMHTRIGKNSGKNPADFAGEGSLVAFEDMVINEEKYRSVYVREKLRIGTVQTEKGVFTLKARAQLTCSNSRPDVYFAKYKLLSGISKNIVVKGPYMSYEKANSSFQVSRLLSLFDKVNTVPTNINILIPDMFETIPLGCRKQVILNTPYYFIIFDDLYNIDNYPTKIKSSKLWSEEKVVDFEKLFIENNIGFAVPSEMSEKAKLSLLYQLAIRYVFELGDFASRNFTRVEDKVWNLDTEGVFIGKSLRWKKSERILLSKVYIKYKKEIDNVLGSWLNPVSTSNPSFYNRWFMVKRVMGLTDFQINKFKDNLVFLLKHYEEWLLA